MAIKNIIFDLGGVIYDVNYQHTIDAFTDLGALNAKSLYSQAEQTKLFDQYETGVLSTDDFIKGLKRELPSGVTDEEIKLAWNAMLKGLPEHRLDFLEEIAEDYNIYLLSNINEMHLNQVNEEMDKFDYGDLRSYFDGVYYSFEIGLRKPTSEIFEKVLNDEGLDPEETLFIDDSAQHVKGAKKVGLNAFHHIENDIADIFEEVIELF